MKKIFFFIVFFIICINGGFAQSKASFILNFEFDKYDVTKETASRLDSFINNTDHRSVSLIQLNGHTDGRGSNDYNDALSLKRVNAIRNYLRAREVYDSVSFIDKGLGKRQMLNAENTEAERSLNRRVEVIISLKRVDSSKIKPARSLTAIMEDTLTKKGSTVALPNMEFEAGTAKFLPGSLPILKELRKALLNNPKLKIAIEGHICCGPEITEGLGDYRWIPPTFKLSEQRAKMVWEYLTQNGIAASRLSYKGFGSTHPIFPLPEKTEEERITNRRVEIRILEK